MITLKMILEKFNAWCRYRDAVRELSQFSDHELCDIGIRRCDLEDIVRRTGPRRVDAKATASHPPISAFRDAADVVDLARLIPPRDQARIRADVSRATDARRIVGDKSERGQLADAGDGH
jgi:uncharacterized protein YjiS (DUF1127 family)